MHEEMHDYVPQGYVQTVYADRALSPPGEEGMLMQHTVAISRDYSRGSEYLSVICNPKKVAGDHNEHFFFAGVIQHSVDHNVLLAKKTTSALVTGIVPLRFAVHANISPEEKVATCGDLLAFSTDMSPTFLGSQAFRGIALRVVPLTDQNIANLAADRVFAKVVKGGREGDLLLVELL